MTPRILGVLAAATILGLAAVAWWWLDPVDDGIAPGVTAERSSTTGDLPLAANASGNDRDRGGASQRAAEPEPERSEQALEPAAASGDGSEIVPIFGTVVLVDRDRSERAMKLGEVELAFVETDEDGTEHSTPGPRVEVVDGVFRARGQRRGKLRPRELVSGGRRMAIERLAPAELPTMRVLHITAFAPDTARLDVIDAATRLPLHHVTVVREHGPWHRFPVASDESDLVVRDASSPVVVSSRGPGVDPASDASPLSEEFLVTADGHAWNRVDVSFDPDRENLVALTGGGEIEVVVGARDSFRTREGVSEVTSADGVVVEFPLMVRLRQVPAIDEFDRTDAATSTPPADPECIGACVAECWLSGGDPIRLQGLPPGRYTVQVEHGGDGDRPAILGRADAIVEVGQVARVRIALERTPPPRSDGLLTLEIHIPPTVDAHGGRLQLEALDLRGPGRTLALWQPASIADRPHWYRWGPHRLPSGRWQLSAWDRDDWAERFEVFPDGGVPVAVEIPEAATVHVAVRGLEGSPASDERVVLSSRPRRNFDAPVRSWHYLEPSARFDFAATPGPVHFDIRGGDQLVGPVDFVLVAGENEIELEVRRGRGLRLTLFDGRQPVPLAPAVASRIEFARVDAGDGFAERRVARTSTLWIVREGGRWTLALPRLPGFDPIPPIEIDVPPDRFVDHRVDLVRTR